MPLAPLAAAAVLLFQSTAAQKPAPPAATNAADISVTVTYKGKGTVDANHKLIVWTFADPNITSASRPVGTAFASKNGDTVTFKNAPAGPVYVFAVYDATGGYDGVSGPPPPGVPSALYRKLPKGPPTAVKAGGAPIKLTFGDEEPWSK